MRALAVDGEISNHELRREALLLAGMIDNRLSGEDVTLPEKFRDTVAVGQDIDEADEKKLMHDVLCVGADADKTVFEDAIDRALAKNAYDRVCGYSYKVIEPTEEIVFAKRLSHILHAYSKACTLEKKGDLYFHQIARTTLDAEKIVTFNVSGVGSNPCTAFKRQHTQESLSELLLPCFERSIADIGDAIDWEKTHDVRDFLFGVTMIQEMVDQNDMVVLVGPDIARSESYDKCQAFVISTNFTVGPEGFGIVYKRSLTVIAPASPWAVGCTLYHFIKHRILHGGKTASYAHLIECCEHPETVSSSNPFAQYLS